MVLAGVLIGAIGSVVGCTAVARRDVDSRAPADPATPWAAPAGLDTIPAPKKQPMELPKGLLESKEEWTLDDIVDLALRNNPATRASWQAARAASANALSERGAYFPQIDANANYTKSKNSYSQSFAVEQKTYTPSLSLQFILFDFGKRRADVSEARHALHAANWTHNATIQAVVLAVERAYYQYLYAKGLREADRAAVDEAKANLDAAEERHKAGLATKADVLQARSNLAQKKLALQSIEGQIQTVRGSLATAMGLSPTVDYDVGFLPGNVPLTETERTVEELIAEAQKHRPDLAAARAQALGARVHVRSVKAEGLPEISLQGTMSRRYYDNPDNYADNYTEGVFLSLPLFTGGSHSYDVVEAQARANQAVEQYEVLKSRVELDVWTSYYGMKTAAERLTTSREFLDSASESHDVALERYKAGVGSILELLRAQTALEDARAQDVQARTDWFLSLAELAYATGRLEVAKPPAAETKEDSR